MPLVAEFHLRRTKAIFAWVFGLPPLTGPYELAFRSVPDERVDGEALAQRYAKEEERLKALPAIVAQCQTMELLHQWLFPEHAAYAAGIAAGTDGDTTAISRNY